MATFLEALEETTNLFDDLIIKAQLKQFVKFKILVNDKLKEIGKVGKANDITKHLTDIDVVVVVNEQIFEQLEPSQKMIIAEELLAGVSFNQENGKVTINKPDFITFSGIAVKYGIENVAKTKDLISLMFKQKEDAEADNATPTKKAE